MGIFSYQPLNKSLCPPVHRSHIFVCTTLRFYKKFSQNFACIVERFTNRYIILIGLFLMELLPFLLHQQICSWMSSFIINSNRSTLSKLAHYHMQIRIYIYYYNNLVWQFIKEFQVKFVPDKQIEIIDKYVLFCSKCMGDK
jgi:hypothetical protein